MGFPSVAVTDDLGRSEATSSLWRAVGIAQRDHPEIIKLCGKYVNQSGIRITDRLRRNI